MTNIGNSLANSVWEATLQDGVKPGPSATREEKEEFVKSKYVTKSFLKPVATDSCLSDLLVNAILE